MIYPEMILYPENKPTKDGYYCTLYYNHSLQVHLYKCLSFDVKRDKWLWKEPATVHMYMEESRSTYYLECFERVRNPLNDQTNKKEL
jgi:hypothetical protein